MKILSNKMCLLMATEMEATGLIADSIKINEINCPYPVYTNLKFNLLIMGMGKRNAAQATLWALSQGAIHFINAGVCGSLNDELKLFQICYPSIIKDLDLISLNSKEYICNNQEKWAIGSLDQPLHGGQNRAKHQKHVDLVDMEAFGIVSTLSELSQNLKLIKCISDLCQIGGSAEIKKNLPKAAGLLREAIYQSLKG